MRVISGVKKGHPLKAVPGVGTRPTTDKVKESLFNIIGPYFSKGIALDLYGGSGGLGIEAISRGMEKVIFVDSDYKAIQTIKENLKTTNFIEKAEVYKNDSKRALKALVKREMVFDYIFLDPPYAKQQLEKEILFIDEHRLLCHSGFIVTEHASSVELKKQLGSLQLIRSEVYGDTVISIFGVPTGEEYNNTLEEEGV